MLRGMEQAAPDGSPLARKALDWLLEMAHERGTDLAWTGRPDDDELDPTLYSGTAGIVLRYARIQEGRDPGYAIAWPDHPPAIPADISRPG
jgi:hypothetical protein